MFHYTPRSVNSREKYLAALADAKAAEAEYLAAESIHLEEQALRRRLEEIQLQKQRQGHPLGSFPTAQTSCCPSEAQAAQPPSSQVASQAQFPHPEALQQLLGLFLGGQQQQQPAPQASSASSQTQPSAAFLGGFEQIMNTLFGQQEKEQQSQAKPNTSTTPEAWKPSTSSTESSLKADLESLLNNEYATEVRDTMQAILASLADSQATPTSASASASGPATPGSSKGKEKASERPVAPATS